MANKDFGKILVAKPTKNKKDDINDLVNVAFINDKLMLTDRIRASIVEGNIILNNNAVEVNITIQPIIAKHGKVDRVNIYRIPSSIYNGSLNDDYIIHSYYSFNSLYNYNDILYNNNLPKDYTYVITATDFSGNIASTVIGDASYIDKLHIYGIYPKHNIIESKNLTIRNIEATDLDGIGYSNGIQLIDNDEIILQWFDIKLIKSQYDYNKYNIGNTFKDTFAESNALRPESIELLFNKYVIYRFIPNNDRHPYYRFPTNIVYQNEYVPKIVNDRHGKWEFESFTINPQYKIKLKPNNIYAFWVGMIFSDFKERE